MCRPGRGSLGHRRGALHDLLHRLSRAAPQRHAVALSRRVLERLDPKGSIATRSRWIRPPEPRRDHRRIAGGTGSWRTTAAAARRQRPPGGRLVRRAGDRTHADNAAEPPPPEAPQPATVAMDPARGSPGAPAVTASRSTPTAETCSRRAGNGHWLVEALPATLAIARIATEGGRRLDRAAAADALENRMPCRWP